MYICIGIYIYIHILDHVRVVSESSEPEFALLWFECKCGFLRD